MTRIMLEHLSGGASMKRRRKRRREKGGARKKKEGGDLVFSSVDYYQGAKSGCLHELCLQFPKLLCHISQNRNSGKQFFYICSGTSVK